MARNVGLPYTPRTPAACILEYIIFLLYLPFFIIWVSATKQASHTHKLSTEWVSATKQASDTHKLFIVWVSATKQASHTHKLFTLRRKKGTEKPVPIFYAHAKAEEGHRGACSYLLCPREGGRRAQRSLFLSPVPTLRRKKGTEKLDPISCAHTEAEEWAQAELVQSTATLRYEPCTQFINVSQRALHIYFIDGCRVCPLDARYKNRTK